MVRKSELKWTVGWSRDPDAAPAKRAAATVPGAVQLDWAAAEGWGDYCCADNFRQYAWMEDVYWSYLGEMDIPDLGPGERVLFVCKGVDYRFQVRLHGRVIHDQEGMFTPFEIDLTGQVKSGDALEVLVFPAPKSHAEPADRSQANQSCKPAVSYGWDFHPRLIPLGIWEETYLEVRPVCHVRDAEVGYRLAGDLSRADVSLSVDLSEPGDGKIRWTLSDPSGSAVIQRETLAASQTVTLSAPLDRPELWWPNGQGDPALYTSVVELLDASREVVHRSQSRVGFRRIRLVMAPAAWDLPVDVPATRCPPPITLEINGRPIFCKGSNWVAPEIFPGTITPERYRALLDLAKQANMNMLRSWGGAVVNKEAFFEMCDERGILLWQEFPLACNRYEGTEGYLAVLDRESRSILRRLRRHASVAIWCGGNELFNPWSRMTDQDAALRLLNRNCFDLDPERPFLATSPLMGIGHGCYVFKTMDGREVFEIFAAASCTAYAEFGCPGPPSADALRRFIPPAELFPPRPGTAWETHHAIGALQPNSHLTLDVLEDYFGPAEYLEQLVEWAQWLQAEGLRFIFEEARRQKPACGMALNWCFNEPWPAAANLSIVAWPCEPKPAYYAVAGSLRPVLAGARIGKFRWSAGEVFDPELWILNDSPDPQPPGRVEALLRMGADEMPLGAWDFPPLEANTNQRGPVLSFPLPEAHTDRMTLTLRVADRPELDSHYHLLYSRRPPRDGTAS